MAGKEPFTVGSWLVEPGLGRISRESTSVTLRRQVMDLLVYLAGKDGDIASTDDLLESLWAGKYVTEGTLYNCVRELRDALGDDQAYIETMPRRGYRLVAPVSTATPESTDAGEARARHLHLLAVLVAIGAMLVFYFWPSALDEQAPAIDAAPAANTIAVLPFDDLSPDRRNDYLGHGISEALIHQLAQVPDLRVVARTSSFSFAGTNADIAEIGDALDVALVLEGSVQKEDDTLRIIAQLIDVRSGTHVWSQKFDRPADSLFGIQDEIGINVARNVAGDALQPAAVAYLAAPDPAAYELYMQGQYHLNTLFAPGQANVNMDAPATASEFFRRATEADPGFALAWAARARSTFFLMLMERIAAEEAMPMIGEFIGKALELGPELAEVQFAAGELKRGPEALAHFDRAVSINPNHSAAHVARAGALMERRRYRESFDAMKTAATLDPLNGQAVEGALYAAFYQGDRDDIAARIAASNRLWPDANGLTTEAHLMFELGRFERFPELQSRAEEIPGFGVVDWYASAPRHFGDTWLTLGMEDIARRWLTTPDMVARYEDVPLLYERDYDAAIEFLIGEMEQARNRPPYAYRSYADIVASLVETYLYDGRFDDLVGFFSELGWSPGLPPLPGCCLTNPPWPEVAYAFALFETGHDDGAQRWLDSMVAELEVRLDQGIRVPNHYYELARLRVMQDRLDDGFEALETAIDLGWRRWYFDRDPILEPLRAHPGFTQLDATYRADIERQRTIVARELSTSRN